MVALLQSYIFQLDYKSRFYNSRTEDQTVNVQSSNLRSVESYFSSSGDATGNYKVGESETQSNSKKQIRQRCIMCTETNLKMITISRAKQKPSLTSMYFFSLLRTLNKHLCNINKMFLIHIPESKKCNGHNKKCPCSQHKRHMTAFFAV